MQVTRVCDSPSVPSQRAALTIRDNIYCIYSRRAYALGERRYQRRAVAAEGWSLEPCYGCGRSRICRKCRSSGSSHYPGEPHPEDWDTPATRPEGCAGLLRRCRIRCPFRGRVGTIFGAVKSVRPPSHPLSLPQNVQVTDRSNRNSSFRFVRTYD